MPQILLTTGITLGLLSYAVLVLGLFGMISFYPILTVSILFGSILIVLFSKLLNRLKIYAMESMSPYGVVLLGLLLLIFLINSVGALGPELAFDALWYQLTIPKLFVDAGRIYFPEESLFYYSLMPKLASMIYTAILVLYNEQGVKISHLIFGVLTAAVTYGIARLYFSKLQSLLAVAIFYANPVVSWLSITSYVDLARSFYEALGLYFFLLYLSNNKARWFIASAVAIGFAVCVKILSLGTIPIFIIGILLFAKESLINRIGKAAYFFLISILIPMPWFLISYFYTKNPFYPLFTELGLRNSIEVLLNPLNFLQTFITTFLLSPDPLHPFYFMVFPFVLLFLGKLYKKYHLLIIYSVVSYMVWYFTSQSGGTRFLTSFLPAYTIVGLLALNAIKSTLYRNIFTIVIIFFCMITIVYRGVANARYVPYLLGTVSKQDFLLSELNFDFGDFIDEDNKIKYLVGEEYVLLHNMHNLYYVDFNFVLNEDDPRWNRNYILVQNTTLPLKYKNAKEVYSNKKTKVTLYRL